MAVSALGSRRLPDTEATLPLSEYTSEDSRAVLLSASLEDHRSMAALPRAGAAAAPSDGVRLMEDSPIDETRSGKGGGAAGAVPSALLGREGLGEPVGVGTVAGPISEHVRPI